MLSPSAPLDRARLLELVCVRLFGQMLEHGHETIETFANLGVFLPEQVPFLFRLDDALTPLLKEFSIIYLILAALQRSA
jgi:hypothetical protein